ncbi:hypothetical protein BDN70DRAFT_875994 [Pholiota conissans]|uniref:Uncharacterized protein n=1 Tax=Pholiota conissans TaxID=109636 RepID=A0A9P6D2R2_9AGAR|nr:hypothetical protein BDN70DRAFT_875994 [Pholiota conissans]
MTAALPFDVVEMVIAILAQNDPNFSSTKSCSLASHDFLLVCRKHIFASIFLNWHANLPPTPIHCRKATTAMLQESILTSRGVVDCIQNLDYYVAAGDWEKPDNVIQTFKQITRNMAYGSLL